MFRHVHSIFSYLLRINPLYCLLLGLTQFNLLYYAIDRLSPNEDKLPLLMECAFTMLYFIWLSIYS